jgi:xylose isomerase
VAMLAWSKRLMGVHINDNYGMQDDDIMVGSVHFWTTVEFLLALQRCGYDGWISLDIVPRRESPVKAATQSIVSLQNMVKVLSRLDLKELGKAQAEQDALETQRIIQNLMR